MNIEIADVRKMESITNKCKAEKNTCTDLFDFLFLKMEPQIPLDLEFTLNFSRPRFGERVRKMFLPKPPYLYAA